MKQSALQALPIADRALTQRQLLQNLVKTLDVAQTILETKKTICFVLIVIVFAKWQINSTISLSVEKNL
jgi:hypothetical protein